MPTCTSHQRNLSFKAHGFPLLLRKCRERAQNRLVQRRRCQGVDNTFRQTSEDFARTHFIDVQRPARRDKFTLFVHSTGCTTGLNQRIARIAASVFAFTSSVVYYRHRWRAKGILANSNRQLIAAGFISARSATVIRSPAAAARFAPAAYELRPRVLPPLYARR